ncbi:MAG: DsbA family protein [Chloroflexi bacterium]|jgi:protein-disulfide isomerase|nr:DsbA family protein [Chloroflexota bacterium]
MVWLTGAALAVGVIVILFASGAIGGTTKPTSRIIPPSTTKPAGLVDPANGRALGDPNAPIHVDVWADFQCPGCALYATEIEPTIVAEYVEPGKVHLEFHDYAFLDSRVTTKESQDSAAAARCAGDQGRFWDYHDWLFANQRGENRGAFSRDRLRSIAESIGLDAGAWQSCLEAGDAHAAVTAQTQQGIDAGIGQTPSLVINGTNEQALTLDQLRAKLDAILAGATPSPAATGSPTPAP